MSTIELEKQTQEIDTPEGIMNFLQKRNGQFTKNYKSRYSVTELVGCQRKSAYKQLGIPQEELLADTTLESMWATVRGDFLHNMTYAYKWREMDMEYYVPLDNGKIATLAGRLDMYDWKTKTIIDLKTTKDVYSQAQEGTIPKKEDILQIQCYGTIFSSVIPVQELVLVYADLNDMIAFRIVNEDKTWWLKERILELENSISLKEPPSRQVSKLCHFCKYESECNPFTEEIVEIPNLLKNSTIRRNDHV